jgi:hypothetical protein
MKPPNPTARWIVSMAAVALSLAWLHRLGSGDLGAPPLSIDGVGSWLDHRDTVTAAFALLRLVAIAIGWYVFAVAAIGGVARSLRLARLSAAVDRVTLPFARGMVGGMALFGVMAGPAPVAPHSPDAMVELPADPAPTTDVATLHLLPDVEIAPPTTADSAPTPLPPSTPSTPPAPLPSPPAAESTPSLTGVDTWIVQPGESFWSIASEHLSDANGHTASDEEVATYWRQVVDHNRSRLVNPDDADLLFNGQEIELPPVVSG